MTAKKQKAQPDPLIGRRVRINDDAYANPGADGVITDSDGRGTYQVQLHDGQVQAAYELAEFTVLAQAGAAGGGHMVEADPYVVAFSHTNPRRRRGLDIESLNALAASIKAQGLAQPILVRPLPGGRAQDTFADREAGRPLPVYELVCGERRLRACREAGLETIPMLVRDLTDDQALELQLVENIEREDLDPMEEAEGFALLRDKLGYSGEQIAERIGRGKGKDYVYKTMKLLALTPESREAMYDGHLGRSTGLLVARYPADMQADVVAYIKSLAENGEPAPFRSVAPKVFTRFNLALSTAPFDLADANLVPACGACSECPKRTGAHADLFDDGKDTADSCTDPDCFAGKRQAHIAQVRQQAAKDGFKVLDDEEAQRAVVSPHHSYLSGYVRLTDTAYTETGNDGVERAVTFEDALKKLGKKAPKPRILINPHTAKAEKVITSDLADKLVPEEDESAADSGARAAGRDEDTPPEIAAIGDFRVRRAIVLRIFDAIRNRDRTDADMMLIAQALFMTATQEDPLAQLEHYQGWSAELEDLDYEEALEAVGDKLQSLPPADVAAVLVMAAAETLLMRWTLPASEKVKLVESFGIDVLAVRDKVAEDLQAQDDAATEDEQEEEAAEA
jgi:ParB/RepB/Spo0J family partition protein